MKKPIINIDQFKKGERKSFDSVYQYYFRALVFFARSYVYESELAEEVVNDSMVKLWQYRSRIAKQSQIKAFLYIATKNACIDAIRAKDCQYREKHIADLDTLDLSNMATIEPVAYHRVLYAELLQQIEEAVETLPPSQQLVFRKSIMEGKTTAEIVKETGMTSASIFVQKSKAVHALRSLLAGNSLFLLLIHRLFL